MDFFSIGLTLACLSAASGIIWRAWKWHARGKALAGSAARRPFLSILGGLTDLFFLRRTWRLGALRWSGHMLLVLGFLPLVFLHAMDGVITRPLFAGYEPTLDPWQFLRNFFGLVSLAGLGLLLLNRVKNLRALSTLQDWALLAIVGATLVSGFFLESLKIMSEGDFTRMADDYFPEAEDEELLALKTYWAAENGVRFSVILPADPKILKFGASLHEDRCAGCHSPTSSAFVSRILPLPPAMSDQGRAVFWHLHVGLAFLGLALLPWGKFFHPVATSV
ncbi:MAG: hypothetical protein RBR18_16425, partial [Desulfovibrionaceae bacterium]|nr:hypothetical protein [Desulfovibrionaceae bacterium]